MGIHSSVTCTKQEKMKGARDGGGGGTVPNTCSGS